MAETNTKCDCENIGQVQISDEVIAVIAGTAAMEIDGVVSMSGNFTGDLAEKLGKRNASRGVKVSVADGDVAVDISIVVRLGCKIQDVSAEVQKRVKTAIETMTGLNVNEINVHVISVSN